MRATGAGGVALLAVSVVTIVPPARGPGAGQLLRPLMRDGHGARRRPRGAVRRHGLLRVRDHVVGQAGVLRFRRAGTSPDASARARLRGSRTRARLDRLSTNQAVVVRAADAYLDTRAIGLTAQRAAWLIDTGQDDAADSAALVAKWWASRAGLRVVHATQHLHGGIGADIDYPIHRYHLWGRQIAFSLGTAGSVAAELGALPPSAPPIGAAE